MSIISPFTDYKANSINRPQITKKINNSDFYRNRAIFNTPLRKDVRFGWSANVKPKSVEEKILNLLTDSLHPIKTAITAAHAVPDADAYGSSIDSAGTLQSIGAKVCTVIDDFPAVQFSKMPSPIPNVAATDYIKRPNYISRFMNNFDVAMVTDCATPERTKAYDGTNKSLDLITKAKKIIIVDHHPDSPKQDTNEQQWLKALKEKGVPAKDVLYWREIRASASEMTAELDKEISDEARNKEVKFKYNPMNLEFRQAAAGGIYGDAGGMYTGNTLKLARHSAQQAENGESKTNYVLNWLLNNSGVGKSKINLEEITTIPLAQNEKKALHGALSGENEAPGIEIKNPTSDNPLGILRIRDYTFFNKMADSINSNPEYKKILGAIKLRPSNLAKYFKEEAQDLNRDPNLGGLLIVTDLNKEGKNTFSMSTRSYGNDSANGDLATPGHIVADGLAKKIVNRLVDDKIGEGGGHDNACGFKAFDNKSFDEALPIINQTFDEEIKSKDFTTQNQRN